MKKLWHRMHLLLLITLALLYVVWLLKPDQLGIVAYKLALLLTSAWAAYWGDFLAFPYARPHKWLVEGHHLIGAFCMLRRAIVIGAFVVAMALAL